MLQLFVLAALGPVLVASFALTTWQLGILVTAGFCIAALLSVPAGAIVDRVGVRRSLVALFALSGSALFAFALAPTAWILGLGIALGGVAQAGANPVTNKMILAQVPAAGRGAATGWKQSGVQFGSVVAGVPLVAVASLVDWRWGVAGLAALCLAGIPVAAAVAAPGRPASPPRGAGAMPAAIRILALFSLALGLGLACTQSFLPLYAVTDAGLGPRNAGTLIAVIGATGIAGRVAFARVAGRTAHAVMLLMLLPLGAVGATALIAAAPVHSYLIWAGAVGIGLFAVAANAVSMVIVMRMVPGPSAGRATAIVSRGFFAGFAIGPPLAGALAHAVGFGWMWVAVGAAFTTAYVCALGLRPAALARA